MELARCAAATPDDATPTIPVPTRVPPSTTQQRASPRKTRTPSPMRYAPLFTREAAPAPVAESTDCWACFGSFVPVSYTHLRAHETRHDLVCRLLLEKKKKKI